MIMEKFIRNICGEEETEEEREIICFGIECLIGDIWGVLLTLGIGICLHHFWESVILWLFLYPLRINAGGYHAKTRLGCFFVSAIMLTVALTVFTTSSYYLICYLFLFFVFSSFIWWLAPIDNSSKRLDFLEKKVYRKRTRTILILECISVCIGVIFQWELFVKSVIMSVSIAATSVLIGYLVCLLEKRKCCW